MNLLKMLFGSRKPALNKPAVMPSLSSLTDEDFYMYLEEGKIYLQHSYNQYTADLFKDIRWYWNKDTAYIKRDKAEKREAANKTYKNVRDWVMYCGGRNSGLWIPNWA